MRSKVENRPGQGTKITIRQVCLIGILGGLAAVVMLFEFPLWFAPSFYKLDLSEIIVAVGAFSLGPAAGCLIELIKILVNFLLNGTTTAGVGELANFLMGCSYILPAAWMYRVKKDFRFATIGLGLGTVTLTVFGSFLNYAVLLPVYSHFYGMPLETFVEMGNKLNPSINSVATLVVFATAPFNLLKGVLSSVGTLLLYRKLVPVLHK